jgi:hypothetical protein
MIDMWAKGDLQVGSVAYLLGEGCDAEDAA